MTPDLRRIRYLINREPAARFRVERAMARATKCTTMLTGMPGGKAPGSQVERGAEDLALARTALAEIRTELKMQREALAPYIDAAASPLKKMVLQLRYMDGYRVPEIAYRLTYDRSYIYRVLQEAEQEIIAE